MLFRRISIWILKFISDIERKTGVRFLRNIKVYVLAQLIKSDNYLDNDITNIVCSKPKKTGNNMRAIMKLEKNKDNIFQISPRGIVYCILNHNMEMIQYLAKLGYPIEMVKYANNYHLISDKYARDPFVTSVLNEYIK